MWYWKAVAENRSKKEKITFKGEGYPDKEIAGWELENWMKKFLPILFMYRITKMEVFHDEAGDNQ